MAFDFIFMLTANDRTVSDARARLNDVLAGGARHIGFKDVGLPFEELKELASEIRAAGGRAYLEVHLPSPTEGTWLVSGCRDLSELRPWHVGLPLKLSAQ